MKLSKIYCNDKRFKNIKFNLNGINVIYADVESAKNEKKNSHDLGKTKFGEIIDFLLLKVIGKNHFLKRIKEFRSHIFYLELYLNSGKFLTIKRGVENNTKISFSLNEQTTQDFSPPLKWQENSSFDKAKDKLSQYLAMDFFDNKSYNYRKSISYALRKQDDFKDVYKLNKFSRGKDIDWKPFVFDLLGFKGELLKLKYESDSKIDEIKKEIENLKENFVIENRDRVVAQIESLNNELKEIEKQIDMFNFYEQDKTIIQRGIDELERQISELNKVSYRLNYEIEKLKSSIKNNFSFDIEKIRQIFEETKVYFPDNLSTDYENLINFNKNLTSERNKLLRETAKIKETELKDINKKLIQLNLEREQLLSGITDTDTFKKFKYHQKILAKKEGELSKIKQQLETIDKILTKEDEIKHLDNQISSTIEEIKSILNKTEENKKYNEIRNHFNKFYKEIMNENALLSLQINNNNNIDFLPPEVKSKKDNQTNTAKNEGNTYMKLLCVAFDLAIIKIYNNESYYRFIYHDDVLSQQDNGVKTRLLNLLEKINQETNIQYIFSVIKSDLPMDDKDHIIYFAEDKVILKLDDKEQSGTLFGFEF